jgi:hypothetical protein
MNFIRNELMTRYELRYIYYVRNQLEIIPSAHLHWNLHLREEGAPEKSVDEFFQWRKSEYSFLNSISPFWAKVLPRERIFSRAYNIKTLLKGNIIFDICDILGVDIPDNLFTDLKLNSLWGKSTKRVREPVLKKQIIDYYAEENIAYAEQFLDESNSITFLKGFVD